MVYPLKSYFSSGKWQVASGKWQVASDKRCPERSRGVASAAQSEVEGVTSAAQSEVEGWQALPRVKSRGGKWQVMP